MNIEALAHILETVSGQRLLTAAVRHFEPDQHFNRADLARVLNTDEPTVLAWIRQLGRPASRYGISVFTRHEHCAYSVSPAMHTAVTHLLAETEQQQ